MRRALRRKGERPPGFRKLPARARRFVVVVDGFALAAAIVLLKGAVWRGADAITAVAFLACGVLSVEVFRRIGAPHRRVDRPFDDLTAAFLLPAALLLPTIYAALVPLPLNVLFQTRVTRLPVVKFVFNIAVTVLACIGAAEARGLVLGSSYPRAADFGSLRVIATLFLAIIVYLLINKALVMGVVRRAAPGVPWRALLWDAEGWTLAIGDVCAGVVLTLAWVASPGLMVFALIPIFLLQRSVIHSHLVTASRHDAKTGLANPSWWRMESGRAVTRAQHGGGALAVLVVDLDHFKAVNDRHGHLIGDKVLAVVADTIRAVVRPGDLVGRFGGDEFTVLLTAVDELQAVATAERLRHRLDGALRQALTVEDPPLLVTASVGVALFGSAGIELDELLTAADSAMYEAKALGGNAVCLAGRARGAGPSPTRPVAAQDARLSGPAVFDAGEETQRPDQQTQSI